MMSIIIDVLHLLKLDIKLSTYFLNVNMKAFKLDYDTSWKFLPWNQINERILIIQKKIYQASKTCKYYFVHKTQNILINSNEAKILAIEEIFKSLSKSSLNYSRNSYQLNDKDKYLIFYSLFQKQKINTSLTILKEKVKQYLVYLCIQPEWEARFEPGLQSNLNGQRSHLLQERLIDFLNYRLNLTKNWQGIYFGYRVSNKYIDLQYINQRIQSGMYINYYLHFWLSYNYIEELAKHLILNLKLNALNQLLYRIIYNGIEWFYSMTIELQLKSRQYNIYENSIVCHPINIRNWLCINNDFITNLSFILKFLGLSINKCNINYIKDKDHIFHIPYYYKLNTLLDITQNLYILIVSDICKLLFRLVKHLIYTKDFMNRLRANTSISIYKVISNINKLVLEFYDYYFLFLSLRIIKYIHQEIDFILYSWLKKRNRNKNKHLIKVIIHRNKKYIIKSLAKYKHYIVNKICTEKFNLIGSSRMK